MKSQPISFVRDVTNYRVNAPLHFELVITAARISKEVARDILLNNLSVIRGGNLHFMAIKHIGLDVYEVKLRPQGEHNSIMVDQWELHRIENCNAS